MTRGHSRQWVQRQLVLVWKGYQYFTAYFSSREIFSTLRIRMPIPAICLSFRALIFFSWFHYVLKMQPLSRINISLAAATKTVPETGGERKGREIKDANDLLDHLALPLGLFQGVLSSLAQKSPGPLPLPSEGVPLCVERNLHKCKKLYTIEVKETD